MTQNKNESFLNVKTVNITEREHAFKSFASAYNVEILHSFDPEPLNLLLKVN